MPKGTYKNAFLAKKMQKIMKLTKCDAVKIENNRQNSNIIKKISTI